MKLHGYLDYVDCGRIGGWARDDDAPEVPVSLLVIANGELIARVIANTFRADLPKANRGNGRLAFEVAVAGRLSPFVSHIVEVRSELDGEHLIGSPYILEKSTALDSATKAAIGRSLASTATDAEFEDRLGFLADQMHALRLLRDRHLARANDREMRAQKPRRVDPPGTIAAGQRRLRALVIDDRAPASARDAGSVAILSHMRSLQRLAYEVSFVPADMGRDGAELQNHGVVCLTRPWYASVEEVLARNAGRFDLVYMHRLGNVQYYSSLVRRHLPGAHLVYAVADLESVRLSRQAELEQRPALLAKARAMRAAELSACRQADAVITHSTFEADLLRKHIDGSKVHVVPFSSDVRPTRVPFAARGGFAFIGSYDHSPNADAAHWLVESIMPEITKHSPTLKCMLVGSAMPEYLRKRATETILPVGTVDDLSTVFDRIRLTIAPLAYGAGIKGKVLHSLAAGVPCVCTPAAAEGLDLPTELEALVAGDAVSLARLVVQLHEDEEFNGRASEAGLAYIKAQASELAVDASLRAATRRTLPGTEHVGSLIRFPGHTAMPSSVYFKAPYTIQLVS